MNTNSNNQPENAKPPKSLFAYCAYEPLWLGWAVTMLVAGGWMCFHAVSLKAQGQFGTGLVLVACGSGIAVLGVVLLALHKLCWTQLSRAK